MDYKKFIQLLPSFYENWGQELVQPKSDKFEQALQQLGRATTPNIMQLLNCAVSCMEPDETYCELGCAVGTNLIGALLDNPSYTAYAVDIFPSTSAELLEKLSENLSTFNLEERVYAFEQELDEFLFEMRGLEIENKIGVCFLNADEDYRNIFLQLLLVKPLVAEQALLIIGNSNNITVQQAVWDFISAHPQCRAILNLSTPTNKHQTFWNGIQVLSWDINQKYNYDFLEIKKEWEEVFVQDIYNWELEHEHRQQTIDTLLKEAIKLEDFQFHKEAQRIYEEILRWNPNNRYALFNLGMLYYKTECYQQALELLIKSIEVKSSSPVTNIQHNSIGRVFEKLGDIPQAIQAYQQSIILKPDWIDAYNNLGNIFFKIGELEQAESIYRQAIAIQPKHFGGYLNLGNVLMKQGKVEKAIQSYNQALSLDQNNPDIYYNLAVALAKKNDVVRSIFNYGNYFYLKGEYQKASNYYQQFLELHPGDVDLYIALAKCFEKLNQHSKAIDIYRHGINCHPNDATFYFYLALALQDFGSTEEAIAVTSEASALFPHDLYLKYLQHLSLLPIIYETEAEIDDYRNRFQQGLEELIKHTSLDTPEARKSALNGISGTTTFYLQYQGKDDLAFQKLYGELVHKIMSANYPQWVKPLVMPPHNTNSKIRIGYVSECMRRHTVGNLMLGFLRHYNRTEFEIYCYYTEPTIDQLTKQFQLYSDAFYHIPGDFESICNQIVANQLHVLVYFDIGMHSQMTKMAGLRLAPVQCTTWGHPITTGIPTIDYFLSSDLMEPEDAEKHYSEQLIRLPNIGIAYSKPVIPEITKTRADFQLRNDAIVYLSCQSLFKYLPQYDYVFPAIAQKVSQAQFAFLSHPSKHITDKLRQRLQRSFASYGLHSEDYCVILPRQNALGYLNVNLVSDIFLDTFTWSGGNTTLEAIACNLPVVTCPGEFMRGRHSYGILRMLGVTDTIAKSEAEYIEIAVKLGLDQEWRENIVKRMADCHSYLYDDKTCVKALEAFYRRVVQEGQSAVTANM